MEHCAPFAMPRVGSSGWPKRLQAVHSISRILSDQKYGPLRFDTRLMVVLSVL
jgi:hypothetical protein